MICFAPFFAILNRPFSTAATRSALRTFAFGLVLLVLLCAAAQGAQPHDDHAPVQSAGEKDGHAVTSAYEALAPARRAEHHAVEDATTETRSDPVHATVDHGIENETVLDKGVEDGHAVAPAEHAHGESAVADLHAAEPALAHGSAAANLHGADPHEATEGRRDDPRKYVLPEPVDPRKKIAFFHEMGRRAWKTGAWARAEEAFASGLAVNSPVEHKRDLLLELGGLYSAAGDNMKAIATWEKFCQQLPSDSAVPELFLKLGLLYRDTGALTKAISRFFLVLNSTLRLAPDKLDQYRKLAMKARLEIAEAYLIQGEQEEARKYFSRLEVLDLDDSDRERVLYRGAQLQSSLGKWVDAERQLGTFLVAYPESQKAPEVRYLRAQALEKLDRREEAVREVLALLQIPDRPGAKGNNELITWKRRTGNELGNRFYEQGDIMGALSIYQALVKSSDDLIWQWPAVYQIGLCFERLKLPDRAVQAYRLILKPGQTSLPPASYPANLSAVQSMAQWRLDHLGWVEDFEKNLKSLTLDAVTES